MDLERGYGNFVEDDREKEGRLFVDGALTMRDEQDEHKDNQLWQRD